jgi:hypothetical protein
MVSSLLLTSSERAPHSLSINAQYSGKFSVMTSALRNSMTRLTRARAFRKAAFFCFIAQRLAVYFLYNVLNTPQEPKNDY